MLYGYYSKSVYALLHDKTTGIRAHVDWEIRLRIAIGAARGVAEIHSQIGGTLVHGNIKSSNIFLDSEKYGCVSDLGLTNMIETTFMPSARCYAPEVKNTRNISQASDVYSFGILLLELITRKSTEVVDLVKLVTSEKRAYKVYDVDLLRSSTIREHTVNMLEIGIRCIAKSRKKRPKMSEVVKMLETISLMNLVSHGPPKVTISLMNLVSHGPPKVNYVPSKLVFLGDAKPTFDLDDMLRANAEVLGKGTFGTSYKASLENGITIRVKRLKDSTATLNAFRQHMEVIGRMRHANVADVRAYHYLEEEKMLVYDYYNEDSLSALLHGKFGVVKAPLDLETRLKIAVGAARGIAHIHEQDGRQLVHGCIKSSNIFLDEQKYGIISDTGIGKVSSPIKRSSIRSSGYWAPEITDTEKVSQASDVFSFGVVLFELVSGRPAQNNNNDGKVESLVRWVRSVAQGEWNTEVIDIDLMIAIEGNQNDEERVMQLLGRAMDCVAFSSKRRPRMFQVVKMLEEISGIEVETSIESGIEDRGGKLPIVSTLECLLEDLLPKLTV